LTVLAYKAGILAADTQLTGGSAINRAQKIVRLPDGGVAGGCGLWSRAYAGLKWLEEGRRGDPPDMTGATLLIVKPDGTIWLAEDEFPEYPLIAEYASVGCGSDAATMAMRLGLGAVEAVQHTIGQDAFCGELVQSIEVILQQELPDVKTHTKRVTKAPAKKARRGK
jgi:hypothetical protein